MGGSSTQTIGYRYFMGLHMAVCHGPVDSFNEIYVGERSLDIGANYTTNTTFDITRGSLFGGDEKEGGIVGTIDIEFGAGDQLQNAYLYSHFGEQTPAFRGVTCAVFRAQSSPLVPEHRSSSGGGYIAAMSPYPKAWAFEVTDIPGGSFNPTKQNINNGANGGHIIYDCLTDVDWGLGILGSDLVMSNFTEATNTLYDGNLGLSLLYSRQSAMEEFLQEVLTHINGVLYNDRQPDKFILKLIRDDFDVNTLPIFDETNIASMVSFERPAFAELVNEITITYRRQGDFKDSSITVQDLASIQAQGAVVSQTSSFAGIDTDVNAALIAQRELKQASTPLARCKIVANREAWNVNPGDVIKISWAAYNISQIVMRVVSVDYGTFRDGLVSMDLIEDIFGLPSNTYLSAGASGWTDEVTAPEVSPSSIEVELPYFVSGTTFTNDQLTELSSTTGSIQVMAREPEGASLGFDVHTSVAALAYEYAGSGAFSPTAEFTNLVGRTDSIAIPIQNTTGALTAITAGSYAYVNGEALRIDSVDLIGGLLNVGRGYLDTVPQSHPSGSVIYFADANSFVDETIYEISDVVKSKALPQTGQGVLDISLAPEMTTTITGRSGRPYPPSQVKINGEYFPTAIGSASVTVTWEHQDRTQQLVVGGSDWFTTALGEPESGVLYTVYYYNNDTSALLKTDANLTGKASQYTVPGAIGVTFDMRIEIQAIRDGLICHTPVIHIFGFNKPLEVRVLENTDGRVLENGDRRVLET